MKVRQNLYIGREFSTSLDQLAPRRDGNKPHTINEAFKAWFAGRGAKIDDLLHPRLDPVSREVAACRRDIEVTLEALALFVRYQLTGTAPLPESAAAAIAAGNARFERFIAQLGRQVAGGKRTLSGSEAEPGTA